MSTVIPIRKFELSFLWNFGVIRYFWINSSKFQKQFCHNNILETNTFCNENKNKLLFFVRLFLRSTVGANQLFFIILVYR